MTRRVLAVLVLALGVGAAAAARSADLEARVDRDVVGAGDTLSLVLRLRGGSGNDQPDLAPLQTDFDVLDVRRSERTSIVNGRRDQSTDWWIELAPKRNGAVEIPALHVGAAASAPIAIRVADELPSARAGAASAVAVDLEASEPDPYVQEQVLLTVRVRSPTPVVDGSLADPAVPGAVLERLGDDRAEQREVDGRPEHVIERRYALYPQQSGPLRIPPIVFDGRVQSARSRRRSDPFGDLFGSSGIGQLLGRSGFRNFFGGSAIDDFFGGGGRAVRARSQGLELDVRPRPDTATARWWLPARDVQLIETWKSEPPVFRVGEPVERTLAIRARGLSGSQLPELEVPAVAGLKQYPEPPSDSTYEAGDGTMAVKVQPTSLIPTRPGPLTLPAVELAWWDVDADAPRTARLPERTVEVLPGTAGAEPAAAAPPAIPNEPEPPAPTPPQGSASLPAKVLLGAFAGAVAVAGGVALLRRRLRRTSPRRRAARAQRALRRACRAGAPALAFAALQEIARARWPEAPPLHAAAWGERLGDEDLRAAVDRLERVQYSGGGGSWEGEELWRAYRRARRGRARPAARPRAALPSLYPGR